MNDIIHSSNCFNFIIYADDTTLNSTLNFIQDNNDGLDMESKLNVKLQKANDWLKVNKLSLNVEKTKAMVFHTPQRKVQKPKIFLENNEIEFVEKFNFLGIWLDTNLNWNGHIDVISRKISKTIGVINRLKHFLPQNILLTLYNSMILPYINYGLLSWGWKANKLIKLQKKSVRIITNSKYNSHCDPLFKRLKILKAPDL